mmetsp:Transcript_12263/g.26451  ORF Transcript_12263/g.26451 Transcript_12263/m.26451 type:complete len:337 (-) Transcript_12263:564-1574(-)
MDKMNRWISSVVVVPLPWERHHPLCHHRSCLQGLPVGHLVVVLLLCLLPQLQQPLAAHPAMRRVRVVIVLIHSLCNLFGGSPGCRCRCSLGVHIIVHVALQVLLLHLLLPAGCSWLSPGQGGLGHLRCSRLRQPGHSTLCVEVLCRFIVGRMLHVGHAVVVPASPLCWGWGRHPHPLLLLLCRLLHLTLLLLPAQQHLLLLDALLRLALLLLPALLLGARHALPLLPSIHRYSLALTLAPALAHATTGLVELGHRPPVASRLQALTSLLLTTTLVLHVLAPLLPVLTLVLVVGPGLVALPVPCTLLAHLLVHGHATLLLLLLLLLPLVSQALGSTL